MQKITLLANAELTYHIHENVVISAYGEVEMSKEQELRSVMGHAVVVAEAGPGNAGAAEEVNGADAGVPGGTTTQGGQQQHQQHHQQHQQHQQPYQ